MGLVKTGPPMPAPGTPEHQTVLKALAKKMAVASKRAGQRSAVGPTDQAEDPAGTGGQMNRNKPWASLASMYSRPA